MTTQTTELAQAIVSAQEEAAKVERRRQSKRAVIGLFLVVAIAVGVTVALIWVPTLL
jgi:hypothetical protein